MTDSVYRTFLLLQGVMAVETIRLSKEEVADLIDRQSRARLNMSGARFKSLWASGRLRKRAEAHEVAILLGLEKSNGRRKP